jgi:DNA-binding phage protein
MTRTGSAEPSETETAMPISLWYESRVSNDKAKQDLASFGNYAQKFGKDLTHRIFGTAAVIGAAIKAFRGATQTFGEALQDATEAGKLGVTIERFQSLKFAAEQTGISVEEMVKTLKEGGPAADSIAAAMDSMKVSTTGIDSALQNQLLVLNTQKEVVNNWLKGVASTVASASIRGGRAVLMSIRAAFTGEGAVDFHTNLGLVNEETNKEAAAILKAREDIKLAMAQRMKDAAKGIKPEKVVNFDGSRPAFTADTLAAMGGATALSGVNTVNFQRDLLRYTEEALQYQKETARNTGTVAAGPSIPA